METLLVAFGAVAPIFIYIIIGLMVKHAKILTSDELKHVNKLVFDVFLSVNMFYSIYISKVSFVDHINVALFALFALLSVFIVTSILVCSFIKNNQERGAMIQSIYRTNFILLGLPIAANIFGIDNVGVTTMLIAGAIPLYNILAVLLLETLRGGTFSFKKIVINIFENPMIIGALLAAICVFLHITLPSIIIKPLNQIRLAATPLALIVLGASFTLGGSKRKLRETTICVISRLLIVPGLVLTIAFLGGFRNIEFISLLGMFATPTAVASFAMAQQLDSDFELAGDVVVYTSALSCFTMFLWIVFFKSLGAF